MNAETFRNLPTAEVARLVRQAESKVCVIPINGTRRWFTLEHPAVKKKDFASSYLDAIIKRSVELYQMIFDHGLETLLTPSLSPVLMARGDHYMQMTATTFTRLIESELPPLCQTHRVRVRFYGDHREFFDQTPYAYLSDMFDEFTEQTKAYDQHRLFMGLFAHDPNETIAKLAVQHYVEHGRIPDKRALIEGYFGEYVDPVDMFIGFGKLRVFDAPLVMTGREDLYYTIAPSPYLDESQLRDILYDHLYVRKRRKADPQPDEVRGILRSHSGSSTGARAELPDDWDLMRDFYQANRGKTLGIGVRQGRGNWYPLPQVQLPDDFAEALLKHAPNDGGET